MKKCKKKYLIKTKKNKKKKRMYIYIYKKNKLHLPLLKGRELTHRAA